MRRDKYRRRKGVALTFFGIIDRRRDRNRLLKAINTDNAIVYEKIIQKEVVEEAVTFKFERKWDVF